MAADRGADSWLWKENPLRYYNFSGENKSDSKYFIQFLFYANGEGAFVPFTSCISLMLWDLRSSFLSTFRANSCKDLVSIATGCLFSLEFHVLCLIAGADKLKQTCGIKVLKMQGQVLHTNVPFKRSNEASCTI